MQYDARLATILCCIADGLQVMTLSGGKPREGDGFTLLVLLWTSRMRVGIRALGIHDWTSDVHTDDCSLSTFRYSTREPCDRV